MAEGVTEQSRSLHGSQEDFARQEGTRNKIFFKGMISMTYFIQPGHTSYHLPIMPSKCDSLNGLTH
jgi:hypothetical protein